MSEDAATAARRIVAEVLGQQDVEEARPSPPTPSVEPSKAAATTSSAAAAGQSQGAGSPVNAAAVARRIVEQVLEEATVHEPGSPASPTLPAHAVEVRVPEMPDRGKSAGSDGLEVDVVAAVPGTREPDHTSGAAEESSAADIVRRIVSDVMADASEPSPAPAAEEAPDVTETAGSEAETLAETLQTVGHREPTRELAPTPGQEDTPSSSGLETEPTREVPAPAESLEQTQQVRRQADSPATEPTREVPVEKSSGTAAHPEASTVPGRETTPDAAPPEAAVSVLDHTAGTANHPPLVEKDGGFEATVNAPEALSTRHEPLIAPPGTGSQAETAPARWLMISILGALALAVLFPMAVAALRALVALG